MSLRADMLRADILLGDCRDKLRELPEASVQAVITSPPYWGLRDYGFAGQIGLEKTPEEYVATMVDVFRAVRRVLRDDGTLWLNMGDGYAVGTNAERNATTITGSHVPASWADRSQRVRRHPDGLKPKDLVGMPWRVAFALQADGWYLRADIIWHKPNPMPESVTDRPTKGHEYVFLLTKRERYFYDAEAVREPAIHAGQCVRTNGNDGMGPGSDGHRTREGVRRGVTECRNLRSVWTIPTQPYPEAHFATFPEALVVPCIKAGTSERGCCAACGAPWARVVDGWRPTCSCEFNRAPYDAIPCTVLDPFAGSGTTLLVANQLGRHGIGIEANPAYVDLAQRRLAQRVML